MVKSIAWVTAPIAISALPFIRPGTAAATTVTVNDPFEPLPCRSAAAQLTVVAPIANVLPDAGTQAAGRAPAPRPDADATNDSAAPEGVVAVAVMFAGTVISGAV